MASQICPHCGGSNPPGAAFCQFCGSAFPTAGGAPLPPSAPPSAPAYPGAAPAWSSGRPVPGPTRPRSRLFTVIVVIVVVILVLGVLAYLLAPSTAPPAIQVPFFLVTSADNVCGLDGASAYGFNASAEASVPQDFEITGASATNWSGTLACTITSVTTDTPGFSLTNVSEPLVVPANETVDLTFSVQCPNADYSGNVTLVMT